MYVAAATRESSRLCVFYEGGTKFSEGFKVGRGVAIYKFSPDFFQPVVGRRQGHGRGSASLQRYRGDFRKGQPSMLAD